MKTRGIGVVARHGLAEIQALISKLCAGAAGDHELVVAVDSSLEGVAEWCVSAGVAVVTGLGRGLAWNRNRALYALRQCDPILLIEDGGDPPDEGFAVTAAALDAVGFLDPAADGAGEQEWVARIKLAALDAPGRGGSGPQRRDPWASDVQREAFLAEQGAMMARLGRAPAADPEPSNLVSRHWRRIARRRDAEGLLDLGRDDVLSLVRKHIARREPLAVVRFGEGEGRLLVAKSGDEFSLGVARRKIRRQTGLMVSDDDVLAIKRNIDLAFDGADVVGVRGSPSFNEEHLDWVRTIEGLLDERLGQGRAPVYVGHCLLNAWLAQDLPNLLAGQRQVSVISCRDVGPHLSALGVGDPKVYQVPSQFIVREVDGDYEASLHGVPIWPDVISQVEHDLVVRHPGELFLVGAGLFGKHLCMLIRGKGGIALDLGSRLDAMVGKVTRGRNKPGAQAARAPSNLAQTV